MKQKLLKRTVLLLCALVAGMSSVWAEDVVFDFNQDTENYGSGVEPLSKTDLVEGTTTFTNDDVTIKYTTKGGNTNLRWWTDGLRVYKDNVFTIEAVEEIESISVEGSITIVETSSTGGTISSNTWTKPTAGGVKSVSFKGNHTSGNKTITTVTVTLKSNTPSIAASNLTIEDNATSGEIEYTINNPVEGKSLTAALKSGDWISDVTVDAANNKVTFTATANTSETDDREGVITLTYGGTLATKDITVTQKKLVAYTVNITAPTGGTLVIKNGEDAVTSGTKFRKGTVLTVVATPNSGYRFDGWKTTIGETTTAGTGDTWTLNANVTFSADFTELSSAHSVDFYFNGNQLGETIQYNEDETIAFPTVPAKAGGKTFIGWAEAAITTPTDVAPTTVKSATMGTADVCYYAVYATIASESWTETDLASLTTSDVFVFSDGNYAMNNDGGTGSAPSANSITVSTTTHQITSTVTDNLKWNLSGNATDGYTFYPNGSTKTWLYCNTTAASGSNNNIRVGTGERKVWTVNGNGYMLTKDTNTDRYLSIYGSQDFRGYINTGNGAFVPKFYKYSATYSAYSSVIAPESITVSDVGYATLVSESPLDFTGVTAYVVSAINSGSVSLTEVTEAPANTPVIIEAAEGTHNLSIVTSASAVGTNLLLASDGTVTGDASTIYALGKKNETVGFYLVGDGVKVPAGKAYLNTSAGVKEFLGFDFNGQTAVSAVKAAAENGVIYNLAGQRVNRAQKGIFIVNGKKVVK